jgi:hypothetical protein
VSHLGAHRGRWDVSSVAADHVAVCFCQAGGFAFGCVVGSDLGVGWEDAGVSAVHAAETVVGVDVGRVAWGASCGGRSGVAELF